MSNRLPTPAECQADPSQLTALATYVNQATWESWTVESDVGVLGRADANLSLFLRHSSLNSISLTSGRRYRVALTQMACIAEVAIQFGDVPTIKFKPAESGEPPVCYLNTMPQYAEAMATIAQAFQTLPPNPDGSVGLQKSAVLTTQGPDGPVYPRPLTDQESQVVRQLIDQSRIQKMQAMQQNLPLPPNIVPPEALVEINDMEEANALQAEFDALAERSNFYFYVTENGLWTNVYGTQYTLCQWDKGAQKWVFTNAEIGVAHPDPIRTDISRSRYFVWWEWLGREEGMALYPSIADEISKYAAAGPPPMPGGYVYSLPQSWLRSYIYTEKVVVSHCYIRHTPYPLTPQQALADGKVLQIPVTDAPKDAGFLAKMGGMFRAAVKTMVPGLQSEGGGQNPVPNAGESNGATDVDEGKAGGDEEGTAADGDTESGTQSEKLPQLPDGGASPVPNQRQAYYLPRKMPTPGSTPVINDDEELKVGDAAGDVDTDIGEITPLHKSWPVRYGIREVTMIAGVIVADHECERVDIPVGQNVNIPMPGMPWGQGEPERMEDIQEAFNSVVTDIVRHGDFSAFPSWVTGKDVATSTPGLIKSKNVIPGQTYNVEPQLIQKYGGVDKVIQRLDAGNLPTDTWKRAEFLQQLFDLLSDRTQASRGQSPDAKSGVAIDLSQQAVKTTTLFKSKRAEMMLKYLANVMRGDILQYRTPEQLAADVGKYPIHVWYELHRRMKAHTLDCAIDVQISSGSGASEQSHTAQIIQAAQTKVAPISPQEILRRLDLDPETQMQENAEWTRDNQQIQQQVATATGTSPGQPASNPAPQSPQPGPVNPTGNVQPPQAIASMGPAVPPSVQ